MPVYRNHQGSMNIADTPIDAIQQALVVLQDSPQYRGKKSYKDIVKAVSERAKNERKEMASALREKIKTTSDERLKGKLQEELKKLDQGTVSPLEVANTLVGLLNDPISTIAEKVPLVPSKAKEIAITGYQLTANTLVTVQLFAPTVQVSSSATAILTPSSAAMSAAGLGSLCPLTMVLAPLSGITGVALMAGKNMSLKDVKEKAERGQGGQYQCICTGRACLKGLDFIIDRSDGLAARIAIASTVVGAVPVALYTIGRKTINKFKGTESEKHQTATHLWTAAQTQGKFSLIITPKGLEPKIEINKAGCPLATVIIATLFGEFAVGTSFPKTIATVAAMDGINNIKREID